MLFRSDGELVVGRDVLIHDPNRDGDLLSLGDQTRLRVGAVVQAAWFPGTPATYVPIGSSSNDQLFDIIILDDGRAANFVSVDGLLVYDDSKIEDLAPPERGQMLSQVLLEQAQPFYVSRYTGSIVLGER